MTTKKDTIETIWPAPVGRALRVLSRKARSALIGVDNWYERWRQRQYLADLSDHLLRDIGISPHEVERECAKPFWRR